jgi:hypothetical protein
MLSADPGGLTHGLQLLRVSCKAQRGVTNHMQGNPAVAECGSWAQAYGAAALGSGQWAHQLALVGMACCQCCLNVILTCQAEQRQYAQNVHCEITTGLDYTQRGKCFLGSRCMVSFWVGEALQAKTLADYSTLSLLHALVPQNETAELI